jgi:glycosyltransferase involved in cell wall biosynthesis
VVVDDGSTDQSRLKIGVFADHVRIVNTIHGGQAAAFNAGWAASTGEIICLLDSDDEFLPGKAEAIVSMFEGLGGVSSRALVCHPLSPIDAEGNVLSGREPEADRSALAGNLYDYARVWGYIPYAGAPTSGLSFTRAFGELMFPLATADDFRHGADDFLVRAASLVSEIRWFDHRLALYRRHGGNATVEQRPRSAQFHSLLDGFLNRKLIDSGRKPVIDFHRSSFARAALAQDGRPLALVALARAIPRRVVTPETLKSAAQTLALVPRAVLTGRFGRSTGDSSTREG